MSFCAARTRMVELAADAIWRQGWRLYERMLGKPSNAPAAVKWLMGTLGALAAKCPLF